MHKVLLLSSDRGIGWFETADRFDDEIDAHIWGDRQVNESKDAYWRCVDAGIDVPFFQSYQVVNV